MLGVGPGVRLVQTCCWGAAYLIREVAGLRGWQEADISNPSHLGTESGPGQHWRSGFQAPAEDVPQARRWREMRRPNSAPLRYRAHTLGEAQLYLFNPLTFLLLALGAASAPAPFALAVVPAQKQLLTPRAMGKGNLAEASAREGTGPSLPKPQWSLQPAGANCNVYGIGGGG